MRHLSAPVLAELTKVMMQPHQGLKLLVLYGSRARGDAHSHSDWDFGYIADVRFEPELLLSHLMYALRTEQVELADLTRASGLLRFRTAAEGMPLLDATGEEFDRFCIQAASFWCDTAFMLDNAYRSVLAGLIHDPP
jgi:predicted nucleotidyltransferase